jgi:uncharacterized RDD family membrane protein YckC
VVLDSQPAEFALTAEEEFLEPSAQSAIDKWEFPLEPSPPPLPPTEEISARAQAPIRWGGFWRRTVALLIDVIMVSAFSAAMAYLSYIGYKVGLAAHGRTVTWDNVTPLFVWLTWGCLGLATAYFVLSHGMGGKTIGKWLMGLRVVGADQTEVTCRQAILRWLAMVGLAPLALGFLWVLWSREKRAWHDLLARTWVVRE